MASAEQFLPTIPAEVHKDLEQRVASWRRSPARPGPGWAYGVDHNYLADLADTWLDGFDWRAVEGRIAAHENYRVVIDGQPVHFLRVPARGTRSLPLVVSHGWPATFWDYRALLGPLSDPAAHGGDPADSFELIVPSMPGFAWSMPLARTGFNYWSVGELWHRLMHDVLGFERYGAHGFDWGDMISFALGHAHPDHVVGVHATRPAPLDVFGGPRPWSTDLISHAGPDVAPELRARLVRWERGVAPHVAVQNIEPDTLAVALDDSPMGWLAWYVQRLRAWSDRGGEDGDLEAVFSREDILTNATMMWGTGSAGSSTRIYAEASRNLWRPVREGRPVVGVPTGLSLFEPDLPLGRSSPVDESYFDLRLVRWHERGGHFPALERPDALIADIRDTFRGLS